MDTHSVETPPPRAQGTVLVPAWWTGSRDRMRLYRAGDTGHLDMIGPYGPERAADITAASSATPVVEWRGLAGEQSVPWRNAQEAVIRARLAGVPR